MFDSPYGWGFAFLVLHIFLSKPVAGAVLAASVGSIIAVASDGVCNIRISVFVGVVISAVTSILCLMVFIADSPYQDIYVGYVGVSGVPMHHVLLVPAVSAFLFYALPTVTTALVIGVIAHSRGSDKAARKSVFIGGSAGLFALVTGYTLNTAGEMAAFLAPFALAVVAVIATIFVTRVIRSRRAMMSP